MTYFKIFETSWALKVIVYFMKLVGNNKNIQIRIEYHNNCSHSYSSRSQRIYSTRNLINLILILFHIIIYISLIFIFISDINTFK